MHLWDIPYALCCHQSFLKRHSLAHDTLTLEQIALLPAVISKPAATWAFIDDESRDVNFTPNAKLTVDDLGLAYHALQSGQFIAMLPTSMIKSDEIVQLPLNNLRTRTRKMYAYYLGRRHAHSQIKHLIDYVRARNSSASG